MTSRFVGLAGLAALAILSSACTYKTQTQVREVPVDYSDYAFYDRAYAPSPSYAATGEGAPHHEAVAHHDRGAAAGNALGFADDSTKRDEGGARETVKETEYQEVQATPGTACYDAAVKSGIVKGTCTLVSERKYVLVGEKAR
jgi:hypothetical protein